MKGYKIRPCEDKVVGLKERKEQESRENNLLGALPRSSLNIFRVVKKCEVTKQANVAVRF
jgi:hypothetical protein